MSETYKRGEKRNLDRLKKARKLLELARFSGYLIDRGRSNPRSCASACITLLDVAIGKEEHEEVIS